MKVILLFFSQTSPNPAELQIEDSLGAELTYEKASLSSMPTSKVPHPNCHTHTHHSKFSGAYATARL